MLAKLQLIGLRLDKVTNWLNVYSYVGVGKDVHLIDFFWVYDILFPPRLLPSSHA